MEPHNHHSSPSFINVAVLLLFAVVIAVASSVTTYFFLSSKSSEQPSVTQIPVVSQTQTNTIPTIPPTIIQTTIPADETANWKVYKNNLLRFTFKYPPSFNLSDNLARVIDNVVPIDADQALKLTNNIDGVKIMLYANPIIDGLAFGLPVTEKNYTLEYVPNRGLRVIKETKHNFTGVALEMMKPYSIDTEIKIATTGSIYFYIYFQQNKDDLSNETIFKNILATFKFLE